MAHPTPPYRAERYDLPRTRDGRVVCLRPTTEASAQDTATALAGIGPWAHYGATPDVLIASMMPANDGRVRFELAVGGVTAGCVMIQPDFLLGPYLTRIAVFPEFQGRGLGGYILDWYEAEVRSVDQGRGTARNLWLCVTGFNEHARRLYLRHGFEIAAVLDNLVRTGDDELLMRKRLR